MSGPSAALNGGVRKSNWWLRRYRPVRKLARLAPHIGVVTKEFSNRTPRAARSSMCGVEMMSLPAAPMEVQCWLSVSKNRMFGRWRSTAGSVLGGRGV